MTEKKDRKKSPKETGGPVVVTGPPVGTHGSRTKDARYTPKRSDAGSGRK